MSKTKPGTVADTGAKPGAILEGVERVNSGIVIRVQDEQKPGHTGWIQGLFTLLAAGGDYRNYLTPYINGKFTARELIDHIAPIVGKRNLHVFNCNMLKLSEQNYGIEEVIEPDALTDIEQHQSEFRDIERTEQQSIVKSRIGQGIFRDELMGLWGGCSVTGLANLTILRASHAKPWRDSTNQERLDPFNGLLLIPNLDVLFDAGLITFEHDGQIRISRLLSEEECLLLGVNHNLRLRKIFPNNQKYLAYHREEVFKK